MVLVSNNMEGSQLFLMNAGGGTVKQVTTSVSPRVWPGWPRDGNGSPVWSPDGSKIASNRDMSLNHEIYRMTPDGKNQTPLNQWMADDIYPVIIKK